MMTHVITSFVVSMLLFGCLADAQTNEPWTSKQLMPPELLAKKIENDQAKDILILSIGDDPIIKGSIDIGAAKEQQNIQKLKEYLKKVPKDKQIVIYCGCCPFSRCPNVRPAFRTITEMGFKNLFLLNLQKSIRADWINKNYPVQD